MKTIDWTKPIQTRDGRAARVICTDAKGHEDCIYVLITQVDGKESVSSYRPSGKYKYSEIWEGAPSDIVNVPEVVKMWKISFYDIALKKPYTRYSKIKEHLLSEESIIKNNKIFILLESTQEVTFEIPS